ncbi:type IV secretion system protein [Ruania zhangjianzhongii]|uniref:type IV secretion system protein n=1 Tax=Ruania zhangjianzhongii TaxID=2603206 RepID=UPI0011D1F639|nr:type IV secretion system protein [Ruania zhangjianzhongii]
MGNAGVSIVGWVVGTVGGAVDSAIQDKLVEAVEWIASALLAGALWLLEQIWALTSATTTPQLGADFLVTWAGRMFTITLPVLGILFMVQLAYAALTRSWSNIGTAVRGLLIGTIGTAASLPIVGLLVAAFDTVADGFAQAALNDLEEHSGSLAQAVAGPAVDAGSAVDVVAAGFPPGMGEAVIVGASAGMVGLMAILLIIGGVMLFFALLARELLLYVVIVIGPLALAGAAFKHTQVWTVRYGAAAVALIFTKLAVVVVFGIGLSMITGVAQDQAGMDEGLALFGRVVGGALMLAMAGLAPMATFKFFDFLGEQGLDRMQSSATAGSRGVTDPIKSMPSPSNVLTRMGRWGGSGGGTPSTSNSSGQSGPEAGSDSGTPSIPPPGPSKAGEEPQGGSDTSSGSGGSGTGSPGPAVPSGPTDDSLAGPGSGSGPAPDRGSSPSGAGPTNAPQPAPPTPRQPPSQSPAAGSAPEEPPQRPAPLPLRTPPPSYVPVKG